MLPRPHRLRRSADFSTVMRNGQRAGRDTVVVHLGRRTGAAQTPSAWPSRFGLVVGRTVGNSVVRHQVSRRLRGVLAARVARVPAGIDVVVRARPQAATATSAQFAADFDSALGAVLRRLDRSRVTGTGSTTRSVLRAPMTTGSSAASHTTAPR